MPRLAVAIAALAAISSPVFAQGWKVEQEEAVSLQHRDAKDEASLLEVHCTGAESQVIVPVPPGIRERKALELRATIGAGVERLHLPASICGPQEGECVDRPAGEVSAYLLRRPGKDLALHLARASRVSTEGGGISISAEANPSVFAEFAQLCRRQRRVPGG